MISDRDKVIYEVFYETSRNDGNNEGYALLKEVKKKCNCTTNDILRAQSFYKTEEIRLGSRVCYSHTTIYDFGISSKDIAKSRRKDIKKEA